MLKNNIKKNNLLVRDKWSEEKALRFVKNLRESLDEMEDY